jgi:hypothetical protein
MKQILDAISLCRMIANDGLKNGSFAETFNFVKTHFANADFDNDFVKQQFEILAKEITDLRAKYEYFTK